MDVQKIRAQAVEQLQSVALDNKVRANALIDGAAQAAAEFAERLDADSPVARFARDAADALTGWSDTLRTKSVDDLVDDSRATIRRSPGLAVGLAVATGFVLSRFLKATSTRADR
ncbi:MAG: hypothetical protein ACRCUI_14860 [Polymorphobacter sp.]